MSVETNPHNYTNMNKTFSQFFMPVRISPKENSGANGKSFPQKIVLPKLRPHCSATCLNTWKAEPQKEKCPFHFQKKLVARKSEKQGTFFIFGVAGVLASAWGFLRIICFESRFELGTINTPIQNSTAFSKPKGGTREARPTDFPPFFQTNSEFLARWRALIFRQGGGSSQRFLWHRPFSQKGLNQKQFCLYSVRLLTSFGKVRANHFACVKDCRFLPRATSFAKVVFLFQHDKFLFQYLGQGSH